jgi:hypothetical protein
LWFETLTGFPERTPPQVRANLRLDDTTLTSRVNGRVLICGRLETPTLAELHRRVGAIAPARGSLKLHELVADVQDLHRDPVNAGALFQVASQFNLLEMMHPGVIPEHGISSYEHDHTQGPACAVACGAGTIYRAYFVEVRGQTGQTAENQIDCLRGVGKVLGNTGGRLWAMRNGYVLPTSSGLEEVGRRIKALAPTGRDQLRSRLRIGIQWHTQVTLDDCRHTVTQAYCSALPVSYSEYSAEQWAPFASLVLEAAYEASLCAAVLNAAGGGSKKVYLTLLGGGAFGNREAWILAALERALDKFSGWPLDVAVVSYHTSNPGVQTLMANRKC